MGANFGKDLSFDDRPFPLNASIAKELGTNTIGRDNTVAGIGGNPLSGESRFAATGNTD
jgi:hypothetical protein